jgi:hypothetical protein
LGAHETAATEDMKANTTRNTATIMIIQDAMSIVIDEDVDQEGMLKIIGPELGRDIASMYHIMERVINGDMWALGRGIMR